MRRAGFTLFEIILVVGLIGLMTLALLPRLGGGSARRLDDAADIIAADLRYTAERAIATGRGHRWLLDLDEQKFLVEEELMPAEDERDDDPTHAGLLDLSPPLSTRHHEPIPNASGRWHWLDEPGVWIERVVLGDDEFSDGEVAIMFSGDGGAEPAAITIIDEHAYETLIRISPFTGEVRIEASWDTP